MLRRLLLGLVLSMLAGRTGRCAYLAYVSNEKSNTVSVIDTSKWEVVRTIKVGQRPRGIAFTKDQKYVLVAVGDDDTIEMIDTKTNEIVDTLAVRSRSRSSSSRTDGQDSLRRQRERQHGDDHRHREARAARRGAGRRRAGRHGHEPGRQDPGEHVGNDEHGAFHRYDDA